MREQFFCFLVAASYVCSLYLIPASIRSLPRDHLTHVWFRVIASGVSTTLSVALTYLLGYRIPGETFLSSVGVRLDSLLHSIVLTMFLMTIFYLGPVVVYALDFWTLTKNEVSWRGELRPREKAQSVFTILQIKFNSLLSSAPLLIHYRNLIHAPITEEIAFRSLMILVLTSVSCFPSDPAPNEDPSSCLTNVALVTPAWFAVAHAHHLLEKLFVSKMPLTSALLSTVIQLTYTSIFGLIASYLFVSTGNLASPIVSHIVCNFFGLPDLGFLTPPRTQNSSSISYLHPWRHALLFLHALGLGLFSLLLLGSSSSSLLRGTMLDIHFRQTTVGRDS